MRSVSDNGATAPIPALTNAFSIDLDRGHRTDDFSSKIVVANARLACAWPIAGPRLAWKRARSGPHSVHIQPEPGPHPDRRITSCRPINDFSFEIIALCGS